MCSAGPGYCLCFVWRAKIKTYVRRSKGKTKGSLLYFTITAIRIKKKNNCSGRRHVHLNALNHTAPILTKR